jgi:hypothetical protein
MAPKAKASRFLLSLATLGILSGCKPNLPTKPPIHLALTATVEIEGKAYPVAFTWSEENYVAWNEGAGWHTEWKSSHRTCIRILDSKYAVVVWLPSVADTELEQFHPTLALIERGNPRFLRSYPTLEREKRETRCFSSLSYRLNDPRLRLPPNQ